MKTSKQFENKNITISARGLVLENGRKRVALRTDPETGYRYFTTFDVTSPTRKRERCLHVEVFRLYCGIPNIPRLDPDDVEFIEGRRPEIRNLQLSEAGMEKVHAKGGRKRGGSQGREGAEEKGKVKSEKAGSRANTADPGGSEAPVEKEAGSVAATPMPGEHTPESSGDDSVPSEEGSSDSPPSALKEEAETDQSTEAEPDRVVAVKGNGSFYKLQSPSGEDLLSVYNDGKQINGKRNVERLAEENGFVVIFES